ncbi:MAG: serine hydrolase [Bacteroidetes bacterium]|nr:serine hydrolase [Bacteroidota bacterium]MBS1929487.1 serine hydrolase [Bacteroidota bacterium]
MYIRAFLFFLCGCFAATSILAQRKTDDFLKNILEKNKDSLFQQVLSHPDEYRLQIIYTQINRDKNNKPTFTNYYFNVDSLFFFNPASTVKLPLAALSLEKLNEMKLAGVNKFTSMQFDSAYPKQVKELHDSTSESGYPSIAQFIRKAFLISDNDAYNRMYQFVGQQTINRNLHSKGYSSTRITREFMGYTEDQNRHTNPINFINMNGTVIYHQPMQYNTDSFDFSHIIKIGKGHYDNHDSLINEPIDFTKVNNLPLKDLQQILQSILFPLSVPAMQRFNLAKDDYAFLKQFLSQYPSETNYPKYDTSEYFDSYVKFFFRDSLHHSMPSNIRVFNKVGWAYGFMIDASYVADFKNKVEFMLSATIYANSDGILNDDKYDDETVSHPFLYSLGQTIYQYELKRTRKYKPNLRDFKINYEKRNSHDTRPAIKNADN